MTITGDGDLLRKILQFDQEGLIELYDRYSPEIYRYAYRLLGDEDWAEECVSETFSRLLTAIYQNKGPTNHIRAYLFRIAHNWITDQFRQSKYQEVELEENYTNALLDNTEHDAGFRIQLSEIRVALRQLTPEQRQVIMLKYVEGWNNQEVAETLQKPVGAVKSLQHRAIANLRELLKEPSSYYQYAAFDHHDYKKLSIEEG